jgi:hypothetical protein
MSNSNTSLDNGHSIRIVGVTSFALAGQNLSGGSVPYIFVDVITPHDSLYRVTATAGHNSLLH